MQWLKISAIHWPVCLLFFPLFLSLSHSPSYYSVNLPFTLHFIYSYVQIIHWRCPASQAPCRVRKSSRHVQIQCLHNIMSTKVPSLCLHMPKCKTCLLTLKKKERKRIRQWKENWETLSNTVPSLINNYTRTNEQDNIKILVLITNKKLSYLLYIVTSPIPKICSILFRHYRQKMKSMTF